MLHGAGLSRDFQILQWFNGELVSRNTLEKKLGIPHGGMKHHLKSGKSIEEVISYFMLKLEKQG